MSARRNNRTLYLQSDNEVSPDKTRTRHETPARTWLTAFVVAVALIMMSACSQEDAADITETPDEPDDP